MSDNPLEMLKRLLLDKRPPKDLKKVGELNTEELAENRAIKAALYAAEKQEEALERTAKELDARSELFWCRLRRRLKVEEMDYVTMRDVDEGKVELWGGNHEKEGEGEFDEN